MSSFQSKIFNKLKEEEPPKKDSSEIFAKIISMANRDIKNNANVEKKDNYRTNIFQKVSIPKQENQTVNNILNKIKAISEVPVIFKKAAFFITNESIADLQKLIKNLDQNQKYAWEFFFDEVELPNRTALSKVFSQNIKLRFDYKLLQPESLVNDYDMIIVLSPDEYSHRLAIEAVRKGKIAVSTMTVQGNTSNGRHYHAENIDQVLFLLPNIMK